MNYDRSTDSGRENKGYNSRYSYENVRRDISNSIAAKPFREAAEKRERERALRSFNEKGHSEQLIKLGRLCAYAEAFDNIPLSEQKILPVGQIENPMETESFQKGYERGKVLVKQGLPEEAYHRDLIDYENLYRTNGKNR